MSTIALAAPTPLVGSVTTRKQCAAGWSGSVALPNLHLQVNKICVTGWPWDTTVFVQWDATATLLNGDNSYFNRGFHVISMRWGTASAGLKEAVAEQIVS